MSVLDLQVLEYNKDKGYKVKYSLCVDGTTIRRSCAWFKNGILSRDNDKNFLLARIKNLIEKEV